MKIDPQTSERLGCVIVDPDIQTRISCFLIGIKQANATVLTRVEFQPMARELSNRMKNIPSTNGRILPAQ